MAVSQYVYKGKEIAAASCGLHAHLKILRWFLQRYITYLPNKFGSGRLKFVGDVP